MATLESPSGCRGQWHPPGFCLVVKSWRRGGNIRVLIRIGFSQNTPGDIFGPCGGSEFISIDFEIRLVFVAESDVVMIEHVFCGGKSVGVRQWNHPLDARGGSVV